MYGRNGRLLRSITWHEPRFTEQDRAELFALEMYRDSLCPLCGRPKRICTSDESAGPEFTASYLPCRATMAILAEQRALTDDGRKPRPNAPSYLWRVATRNRR